MLSKILSVNTACCYFTSDIWYFVTVVEVWPFSGLLSRQHVSSFPSYKKCTIFNLLKWKMRNSSWNLVL